MSRYKSVTEMVKGLPGFEDLAKALETLTATPEQSIDVLKIVIRAQSDRLKILEDRVEGLHKAHQAQWERIDELEGVEDGTGNVPGGHGKCEPVGACVDRCGDREDGGQVGIGGDSAGGGNDASDAALNLALNDLRLRLTKTHVVIERAGDPTGHLAWLHEMGAEKVAKEVERVFVPILRRHREYTDYWHKNSEIMARRAEEAEQERDQQVAEREESLVKLKAKLDRSEEEVDCWVDNFNTQVQENLEKDRKLGRLIGFCFDRGYSTEFIDSILNGEDYERHKLESPIEVQITHLANFIMAEVDGEPSESEGACDTAIRIIKDLQGEVEEYREALNTQGELTEALRGEIKNLKDKRIEALKRTVLKE